MYVQEKVEGKTILLEMQIRFKDSKKYSGQHIRVYFFCNMLYKE